jgi:Flp pilus assembly protein TadG
MRPPLRPRLRDDERGATLAIVAISLIALFGMVILVVDVGGLLWKRRELVNGSDAAALAAAKTCAVSVTRDPQNPEAVADTWATTNVGGLTASQGGIVSSVCRQPLGYVTVQYSTPQQLFFAPVLGFGGSNPVTTRATAIYGSPGAANPVPIVVYANSFNSCRLDQDPTPGAQCYIWEDNNNTQGAQSGFGFLDLRRDNPSRYGWDSRPGATCPNAGNDPRTWIENYPDPNVGELPVNYPEPTYVCRLSGLQDSTWEALERRVGQELTFPINRCDATLPGDPYGQIARNGSEVACGNTPHQYDIIGFVALKLLAVYRPNEVQGQTGTCGPITRPFPGALGSYNLDQLGIAQGCFTTAPDAIDGSSVTVTRASGTPRPDPRRGPDGPTCTGTTHDWCYDPPTRTIRWNTAGPAADNRNYEIRFQYRNDGPCGTPPAGNNSGHCLVVEVVDVRIGGTGAGGGDPNSNLRAIQLCNPEVTGSCAPVQVP